MSFGAAPLNAAYLSRQLIIAEFIIPAWLNAECPWLRLWRFKVRLFDPGFRGLANEWPRREAGPTCPYDVHRPNRKHCNTPQVIYSGLFRFQISESSFHFPPTLSQMTTYLPTISCGLSPLVLINA
jgi:hypothetical protein